MLAIAALVTAFGCGVRTPPRAPEETAARAPDNFRVESRREGVAIEWGRPTKTADGERLYDLSEFVVERRAADGSFIPLATIDVTDQDRIRPQRTFHYRDSAEPGLYEYRVHAVTADGEPGLSTQPARVEVLPAGAAPADAAPATVAPVDAAPANNVAPATALPANVVPAGVPSATEARP